MFPIRHGPLHRLLRRIRYRGSARYCPVCRSTVRRFLPHGTPPRADARCPVCGSLERHRALWLHLAQATDLFDGRPKRILHAAPEPHLARLLQRVPGAWYLSIDLAPGKAMLRADLTRLQFADAAFDVIFCSHVLEHIPDDHAAMAELRRVLHPSGWAILQVPISGEVTREDPSVTSDEERTRLYGQRDHVRYYGADFKDRLEAAGFAVQVKLPAADLPHGEVARMGLGAGQRIHYCRSQGETG